MISGTNNSNKQFIAVILFIAFIVLSIIGISKYGDSSNPKKSNNSNSNSNIKVDPNTPKVKESEPVVIVTSNTNIISNSNTTSNKISNKVSNKVSNKTSNNNPNYIPVAYFITELSANKIYVAGSAKINVDVYPVNATSKKVKYTSTNTNIARVGDDGTVIGISEGVCYIDISVSDGLSSRVQIQVFNRQSSNVTPTSNKPSNNNTKSNSNKTSNSNSTSNKPTEIPVSAIGLNYSEVSLNPGDTLQLSTTIYPSNATNKTVTWYSSSPSVANVISGKVTALREGTTIITVKSYNGKYATCRIEVVKPYTPPSEVAVSSLSPTDSTSFSLNQGVTRTIGVTISPSNATNKNISWYSSNTSVASVSGNGTSGNTSTATVTAKSAGTATITARASNGVSTQYTVKVNVKNGWYTENGERVYYNNGTKLPKYGNFDYTLYGTTAWITTYNNRSTNRNNCNFIGLKFMKKPADSGDNWGSLNAGTKVTVVGGTYNTDGSYKADGSGKYLKISYGGHEGYVLTQDVMINLPDVMPNIKYDIKSAYSNNFTVAGYNIANITGYKLYDSGKIWNSKLHRNEYYAPLQFPVARKLQSALNSAKSQGYNFIIYDTYRPTPVETKIYNNYMNLYNNNATVRAAINRNGYNINWFMTSGGSKHSQGIAIDMGLTNSSGTVLSAQTNYGVLDESSVVDHNNGNANKLKSLMTNAGFFSLKSEWWHYDDRNNSTYGTYQCKKYESFQLK